MYVTDFKSVKDKDISSNVIIYCFFCLRILTLIQKIVKNDSNRFVVTEIKSEKYIVIATIVRSDIILELNLIQIKIKAKLNSKKIILLI